MKVPLAPRWSFTGYADVGAGGSDSTWQAMGGFDYAISDFLWNMATGGPYLGVSLAF